MKHAREAAGRHRAEVRPRYGRIGVVGAAALVTLIAVAGGFGLLPEGEQRAAAASAPTSAERTDGGGAEAAELLDQGDPGRTDQTVADAMPSPTPSAERKPREKAATPPAESTALPAASGEGRRVVFSEGRQRVWLVGEDGAVQRTHLASGSVYDNLDPGTYEVFSRSRHAVGIDDSGTMEFFVRFTYGDAGAAIGFHSIPVSDGKPVQTLQQLGTPLSHGCIRQRRADAIALWDFAPLGTTVVVTP